MEFAKYVRRVFDHNFSERSTGNLHRVYVSKKLKKTLRSITKHAKRNPQSFYLFLIEDALTPDFLRSVPFDSKSPREFELRIQVTPFWWKRLEDAAEEFNIANGSPCHLAGLAMAHTLSKKTVSEWGRFFYNGEDLVLRSLRYLEHYGHQLDIENHYKQLRNDRASEVHQKDDTKK